MATKLLIKKSGAIQMPGAYRPVKEFLEQVIQRIDRGDFDEPWECVVMIQGKPINSEDTSYYHLTNGITRERELWIVEVVRKFILGE